MIENEVLFEAMALGLQETENQFPRIGLKHWKLAMVAYDPDNPNAFLVIGSRGQEPFQEKLARVVNPDWDPSRDAAARRAAQIGQS